MPQMAPLSWTTLMIFFLSLLLILNIINFYSFTKSTKKSNIKKSKTETNWKW